MRELLTTYYLPFTTHYLPPTALRQMRELLAAARQLYGSKKGELETMTMRLANGEMLGAPGDANGEGADGADGAEGEGAAGDAAEGVGTDDREKSLGLAIGRAPDGAKPTGGLIEPPAGARRRVTKGAGREPPSPGGVSDVPEVMDRHEVALTTHPSSSPLTTHHATFTLTPTSTPTLPLPSPLSLRHPRHHTRDTPARGPLSFPSLQISAEFKAEAPSALTRSHRLYPTHTASHSNACEPATSPPPCLSPSPPPFTSNPRPHTNPDPRLVYNPNPNPNDRQAFTQFKGQEGAETNNTLRAAKATQKQMRARRSELGGTVNASKQRCGR